MKTGFARKCITPPLGVYISGYYEERKVKGVLDDLYVSVAAFDDAGKKAAIVAVDALHFSSQRCDKYRAEIAKECKIEEEAVFINCSHTHTGPMVGERLNAVGDKDYEAFLLSSMCVTAKEAFEDLKDSDFYVANGKAENISFVRRYKMKNGKTQTNPGVGNREIDHALGIVNDEVKLLKIERCDADDIYIVSYGTHADTIGGEMISADWPGFVRSTLESSIEGIKCIFLTGTQGDVNHINPLPTPSDRIGLVYDTFDGVPRGYEHAKHMGRVVAGAVLQICGKATPVDNNRICFDTQVVEIPSNQENDKIEESERIIKLYVEGKEDMLPYEKMELTTVVARSRRIVSLKDGPESYFYTLFALKVGEVVFLGTPGELFTEIGMRIQELSPFENTFVCCLTNGGDTYFPTSSAYDEGGYETATSFLKKGGDDILVSGATKLFEKLSSDI